MTTLQYFAEDVISVFEPITKAYRYRCVDSGNGFVTFHSNNALLQVTYDHHCSSEVCVSFDRVCDESRFDRFPFTLPEVYREFEVPGGTEAAVFQTTDYSRVVEFLRLTVNNLKVYCVSLLTGDERVWRRLEERRTRESAVYTKTLALAAVRPAASQAWKEKRFRAFIDLMTEFQDIMPPSERMKLIYCLKHQYDQEDSRS